VTVTPEVLLLENIHPAANEVFERHGYVVHTRSHALSEDELIEAVQGKTLLGVRSNTNVTEKVLGNAPDLLAVGAFCIGTNQIDLLAAAERGVAAFNAPYSNTRSVVELVIGEIIALARRLPEKTQKMHAGVWDKSAQGSHEVRGRTLGIVGYGNIGTQLGNVAEALGFRVILFLIVLSGLLYYVKKKVWARVGGEARDAGWDVVRGPVPESTSGGGVGVVHGHHEALGALGRTLPVERG